jgi:hypothetical protein
MDQTTSAHQILLWQWHLGERGANIGLDCPRSESQGGHPQKAVMPLGQFLHHSTDSEFDAFRENADFIGVSSTTFTKLDP